MNTTPQTDHGLYLLPGERLTRRVRAERSPWGGYALTRLVRVESTVPWVDEYFDWQPAGAILTDEEQEAADFLEDYEQQRQEQWAENAWLRAAETDLDLAEQTRAELAAEQYVSELVQIDADSEGNPIWGHA